MKLVQYSEYLLNTTNTDTGGPMLQNIAQIANSLEQKVQDHGDSRNIFKRAFVLWQRCCRI